MRRRWKPSPIIGPLGAWELLRIARRGHAHRSRLLVIYLLAIAFVFVIATTFGLDHLIELLTTSHMEFELGFLANFSNQFALGLLLAILIALLTMTPAFAAFAISEEKERQTLQLLLTTPLADREIVLGKSIGRLAFQLAAIGAGIPVLCTTMLFGYVSPWLLLTGYLVIISTTTVVTAIGINASCVRPTLRSALIRAYWVTATLVVIPGFFSVLAFLGNGGEYRFLTLLFCAIPFQAIATAALLVNSIRNLRIPEEDQLSTDISQAMRILREQAAKRAHLTEAVVEPLLARPVENEAASVDAGKEYHQRSFEVRDVVLPPLPRINSRDPVGWKERYVVGRSIASDPRTVISSVGFVALAVLLILFGAYDLLDRLQQKAEGTRYIRADNARHLLVAGGTIAAALYIVPAGIGIAGSIARERQRRTLDDLLSIP